jgi:hypothetical protein
MSCSRKKSEGAAFLASVNREPCLLFRDDDGLYLVPSLRLGHHLETIKPFLETMVLWHVQSFWRSETQNNESDFLHADRRVNDKEDLTKVFQSSPDRYSLQVYVEIRFPCKLYACIEIMSENKGDGN